MRLVPLFEAVRWSISIPQAALSAAINCTGAEPPFFIVKYPPAGWPDGSARNHAPETATSAAIAGAPKLQSATTIMINPVVLSMSFHFVAETQENKNTDHASKTRQSARKPNDESPIMLIGEGRNVPDSSADPIHWIVVGGREREHCTQNHL